MGNETNSNFNLIQNGGGIEKPKVRVTDKRTLDTQFIVDTKVNVSKENVGRESFINEEVEQLKSDLTEKFVAIAPDLGTFDLAAGHIDRLTNYLLDKGANSREDLLIGGAYEFYRVGRDILGPLWSAYVDESLSQAEGDETYLFPARDATPFYWVSEGLIDGKKNLNHLGEVRRVHADWNRWFMGQEDELDESGIPLNIASNPLLKRFYLQMGFGNGGKVKIIEPGAWGSAANALKTFMPTQDFELRFLFSHMPDRIYGFLNEHAKDVDPINFEIINDSSEAIPKSYTRPTSLVEENGRVVADRSMHLIDSPFIKVWSKAANRGAYEAGWLHSQGLRVDVNEHVNKLVELSKRAVQGEWTGILPRNTLTWTVGGSWRKDWKWGKIPPLE